MPSLQLLRAICPSDYEGTIPHPLRLTVPARGGECFGQSLAMSRDGSLVIVGAPRHRGPGDTDNAGAVFVFRADSGQAEALELQTVIGPGYAPLNRLVGQSSIYFGSSVAVDADGCFFAVGAYGDRGTAPERGDGHWAHGAVYIFKDDPEFPVLHATIGVGYQGENDVNISLPSNFYFGSSVALSERQGVLAVGAHHASGACNTRSYSGAAFVFAFQPGFRGGRLLSTIGSGYSDTADLSLDLHANEFFGHAISISPTQKIMAIGARGNRSALGRPNAGAVYRFSISADRPVLTHILRDDGTTPIPFVESTMLGMRSIFSSDGQLLFASAAGQRRAASSDGGIWIIDQKTMAVVGQITPDDVRSSVPQGALPEFSWYNLPFAVGPKWLMFGIDMDSMKVDRRYRIPTAFAIITSLRPGV